MLDLITIASALAAQVATVVDDVVVVVGTTERSQALIAVFTVGALLVRTLMKAARSSFVQRMILERLPMLPEELRPTALFALSLALSAAAGFCDHVVNGSTFTEAALAGLLIFLGSEGSFRVQKGVKALRARRADEKTTAAVGKATGNLAQLAVVDRKGGDAA